MASSEEIEPAPFYFQWLISRTRVQPIDARGHGLHGLTSDRQHQPFAVTAKSRMTVCVVQRLELMLREIANRSAALIILQKEVEGAFMVPYREC